MVTNLSQAIIKEGILRDRAIERLCNNQNFKIEKWLNADELKEWEEVLKILYGDKADVIQVWPNSRNS